MALTVTYQRVAHALDWLVKVWRDPADNSTVQAVILVDTDGNPTSGGGGDASAANQVLQTALLTTIDTDTGAIVGHVDGIEALLTAIDSNTNGVEALLTTIDTSLNNIEAAVSSIPTSVSDSSQNVTTAGTRVQLTGATCKKIIITAKAANTGTIWVGGATVAAGRGIPLVALQNTTLDISNANAIYIDATVSGEGITYALLS